MSITGEVLIFVLPSSVNLELTYYAIRNTHPNKFSFKQKYIEGNIYFYVINSSF